jgi:alkylation response protein AidB-like acyl-CoA dehydrogenase
MRWLGVAQRAGVAAGCSERELWDALGAHQMVQAMLADSAIEIHAARLMIWHAAWTLDQGGQGRHETSMASLHLETVNRVIDRAADLRLAAPRWTCRWRCSIATRALSSTTVLEVHHGDRANVLRLAGKAGGTKRWPRG